MDLHLDRRILATGKSKHDGLYKEHLFEADADGQQVGRDLIPWGWSLDYLATEIALRTSLEITAPFKWFKDKDSENDEATKVSHEEQIIAKLTPSDRANPHGRFPRYTMMGTDRPLRDWSLRIASLENEDAEEHCHVWGCPAWTTEVDFHDITVDDSVMFMLGVKPSTFREYVARIREGSISQALLRVQGVDGFYSDWSPAISTSFIKVLTTERHHAVEPEEGLEYEPPRLGKVRECNLTLGKVIDFPQPPKPADDFEEEEDFGDRPRPSPPTPDVIAAQAALRIERALGTVRLALWIAVGLLALLALRRVL